MGSEDQVAEQVAYWVNQKTQNAQMTIDRDGQPVEVSVSLSGNEAHVSFRSDQPETRALLDQSMAQLSDLLRSEGLVLSGMSIDTSAQKSAPGGRESRQSDGREGARQARVATQIPAIASLPVGGSAGTNRTVDIFV
ncbi:MAG: flagellar hook-length control protein FliK [Burkholderiaceae bacterium]|nr:flagellar hook-length control protein FliK [Burkholderiaceae bacterium]